MADSNIEPDPAPSAAEPETNEHEASKIDNLLRRAHRVYGGVFFQILIAPREPRSGEEKLKIIDLQSMKTRRNIDKQTNSDDKHFQIATIRNNYKQMVKAARETFAKIKEEYKDKNFEVLLLRHKEDSKTDHGMASDSDQESEAEAELKLETDTESGSDSEWELKSGPEPKSDKELTDEDKDHSAGKRICKWNNYQKDLEDEYDEDKYQEK